MDDAGCLYSTLVVAPPLVVDTQLGVAAVDVAFTGRLPEPGSGRAAICLGGHPAGECLLEGGAPGPDHGVVVAIDATRPLHWEFASRLAGRFRPEAEFEVVDLNQLEVTR